MKSRKIKFTLENIVKALSITFVLSVTNIVFHNLSSALYGEHSILSEIFFFFSLFLLVLFGGLFFYLVLFGLVKLLKK